MFILAAVILWRCLGLGRQRQQTDDIRVGQDMGYLDGEYVYVRSANQEDAPGEDGLGVSLARRLTSRRGTCIILNINLAGISHCSFRHAWA